MLMKTTRNQHLIVIALKRSGNNAIKDWLLRNRLFAVQGNVRLKHIGKRRPPNAKERSIVPWPLDFSALKRYGSLRFRGMLMLGFPMYIGLEDQGWVAPSDPESRHILIVRSFENVFASRFERSKTGHAAYAGQLGKQLTQQVAWWCNHVEVMDAHTDSRGLPIAGAQIVPIYYDRWLSDANYRIQLGKMLDVSRPEQLPHARGKGGGGSSFDGRSNFQDAGEYEKLLKRSSLLSSEHAAVLAHHLKDPKVIASRELLLQKHGSF